MVAVYAVLYVNATLGVKEATEPVALYVTVPVTAVPPGPFRRKVVALTVAGFSALLNVAVRT